MAKRSADKELTHDNWDQEHEEEEAGVFRSASDDVLKTREIKKAKRRGVTDGQGNAGAFRGFSFGLSTTTSGLSSRPVSFTIQPQSTTNESTTTPAFGSVTVSVAISTVTSTTAGAAVSVTGAASKSCISMSSSEESTSESQYRRSLRTLNESVLRWIDDHIKANPFCILTPVFSDYEKYIKELDRDYPQSSDKVAGSSSQTTSVTAGGGLFSFGTTSTNSEGKPFAAPTSTTAVTTGFSAPGFCFGALDSKSSTGFSFGAQPAKEATSSALGFGAQPAKEATSPASGCSFGAQPAKEATSPASGSSFGAQPAKEASSPASGSSFGAQPAKEATSATPSFIFGTQPSKIASSSGASKEATPASSFFGFGSQSAKGGTFVGSGFGFGAQPSTETNSTPASGFRFNFQPAKEAASSSASTSVPKEGGEDDGYVPPQPEVVDVKEEDAFYTVRCKLYYNINNEFKDRGTGNLYLKPCGERTQLLVRAGTNLGNILLNIMLCKSIPTSCKRNTVSMVCIPYPPLDDKKPEDKTPICVLIRVKKEEDAEALLKQINDHKV